MTEWAKRRFWKTVDVQPTEGNGFAVCLDGRDIRTPARAPLILPTLACAQLVADEWRAQSEVIAPDSMPATRAANAAIDKVGPQLPQVRDIVLSYGDCDLICYRADAPDELVALEEAVWDPLVQWVSDRYGVQLQIVQGVIHHAQPQGVLDPLHRDVQSLGPFRLTALHDLVAMSGSLVIGLATLHGAKPVEELWAASRVDEEWQVSRWGRDDEADALATGRKNAFLAAHRFSVSLQADPDA